MSANHLVHLPAAMHTLAVVPIVINAGAAAFPAIVAAVASILAIVLKLRALVDFLRRRLLAVSAGVVGVILIVVFVRRAWATPAHGPTSSVSRAPISVDWAKVATDIIAQEHLRQVSGQSSAATATIPFSSATPAQSPASTPADPVVAATSIHDFSRALYFGGPSPKGLAPLWTFKPDGVVFFATPAIAGQRIVVAGNQADLGGYTGLLACLDAKTGKPLWQITQIGNDLLRPFFSSPAVTSDGKYVVIGQGLHTDQDCSLLCFDAATGRQLWAVKTPLHIESSPAIYGDIAVVGAGAIEGENGKAIGDPGFVMGVRISDGKLLWKQPINDPESSPAIDDTGMVFIGSGLNGKEIVALRSEPDEVLQQKHLDRIAWRTAVAQPMLAPVTLAGNLVIAAGGNGDMVHSNRNPQGLVVALDRHTGQILWQTPMDNVVLGGIAYQNGLLVCPVRNGEIVALAATDGHVLWRTRVSGNAPVLTGCAVTPDRTYAVSSDGYLAVLANADGKVLEKIYLNDQSQPGAGLSLSSPQIIGNRLIVGTETGGLRNFQGTGGNP